MHDPTLISIRFPTSGSGGTVRRWGVNGGKMGKWKRIRGRLIGKGREKDETGGGRTGDEAM